MTLNQWVEQLHSADGDARKRAEDMITSTVIPRVIDVAEHDTDSAWRPWLVRNLNELPGVDITFEVAYARRVYAVLSLGTIGPLARQAEPFLLERLKAPDVGTRMAAARALSDLKTPAPKLVPTLIEWLNSDSDDVQMGAMNILGNYGKDSHAAIPRLIQLLKSPDKGVPETARDTLERIDPTVRP
jgi:HEAT repeat protein